ncbi:MAG: hypothetical protein ABSH24_20055 [Bryobacteraceae bacterium]|jgi:hypothetical protein
MADAEDSHNVPFEREQDAVVTQAETEGARHIAGSAFTSPEPVRAKCSVPSNRRMAVGRSKARTSALASSSHSMA